MIRPVIIGPLGPAQLACLRSWKRLGYSAGFIHLTDGRPLPLIRGAVGAYLRLSFKDLRSDEGISEIANFLVANKATGLTCLAYELARRLHEIRDRLPATTALWLPATSVIDRLESKAAQNLLAVSAGLDLLPSVAIDKTSAAMVDGDLFPYVLRPDDPTTITPVFKAWLCKTPADLEKFIAACRRIDRPLIAQPYVEGRNFVVHGYRTQTGGSAHWGFAVDRMLDGVTLTIRPAPMPDSLADRCAAFADALGIVGIYHFEFIYDATRHRWFFMEINGRLGGTTAKVYRCGFDEPALIPYCYGAVDTPPLNAIVAHTATSKQALIKCMLRALKGRTTVFEYPRVGVLSRLFDLLPGLLAWRDEIIDWRDPRTTTAYFLQKVYGE